MLRDFLLVAAGGAIGATLRFAASTWIPRGGFPWATLAVNLLGSLLLGYLLSAPLGDGGRLFFAVGVLGAFTTLSTFSLETLDLLWAGHRGWAAGNVAANALGGPAMAAIGWWIRTA